MKTLGKATPYSHKKTENKKNHSQAEAQNPARPTQSDSMWTFAIVTQAILEGRFFRYRKYYYGHMDWKEFFKTKKGKEEDKKSSSAKSSMSKRE